MKVRDKTIEELLDLEEELQAEKEEAEKDGLSAKLIQVYKELYRKIYRDKDSEYAPSLEKIKKQLIFYLVQYGTYLKTVYQKDDNTAESSLKEALRYEKNLPIVYYRLGFLLYKKKQYPSSLHYFQHALLYQQKAPINKYRITDQQIYNSHLYLANCGLFIAKDAKEVLEKMNLTVEREVVTNYEISPLYQMINENNLSLESSAYRIISSDGSRYCSREQCIDMVDLENTIILDLTNRENMLIFNGTEKSLSKDQVEMLRLYIMKSNESNPLIKNDFFDLFSRRDDTAEIKTNTYTKRVNRLTEKLTSVGIAEVVLVNKSWLVENNRTITGYYYNHQYPYVIMYRSDETFILPE
ncbi:tetratricopeptide repeat protein [Anaerobacillus sp. MEB173]|uniref:tetratricopeptide repeat protein n=1 Tax=Anaerobacillus sp. MEB173 TaxID=3383345 RepID=UPI003F9219C3